VRGSCRSIGIKICFILYRGYISMDYMIGCKLKVRGYINIGFRGYINIGFWN